MISDSSENLVQVSLLESLQRVAQKKGCPGAISSDHTCCAASVAAEASAEIGPDSVDHRVSVPDSLSCK